MQSATMNGRSVGAVGAGIAKLANVGLALTAMKQIQGAAPQMPRLAVLAGPAGYGKSQAALYLAHPLGVNAAYVQLRMFDTTKSMAQLIATELDARWKPQWSTAQLFDILCEQLVATGRSLVVDEFDHMAEKAGVDFIRALHDQVATPTFEDDECAGPDWLRRMVVAAEIVSIEKRD